MASERITAYFSHSYRHGDRKVNEFFWRLLWANGFTLTVDPQSESLSVPYLECMMKRSAAFIAVVTRRPEQSRYQCSPFIIFEYGLAVQAQKSAFIFVENGVSNHFFPDRSQTLYFNRQDLGKIKADAESSLRLVAKRSDAAASILGHPLGKVGILIDIQEAHRRKLTHSLIVDFGYTPVELDTNITDSFRLSLLLDTLDFIVLDLDSTRLPPWLLPFISGRFIPTVQLRAKSSSARQPIMLSSEPNDLLEAVAKPEELFVSYDTDVELKRELTKHVERLRSGGDRVLFTSREEGLRYFRSLGRRQDKVFISNAKDANQLVRLLSAALRRENVPHFHYLYHSDVELAKLWEKELPEMIRASRYFLPLITEGYFKSEYCIQEYQLARQLADIGKMQIIPYFLDSSTAYIPDEGRDVSELSVPAQVRSITKDLDQKLTAAEGKQDQKKSTRGVAR